MALQPFEKIKKMLLYLHIPYCDSKCHYCSFNSYVDKFDTRKTYMSALYRQLAYELERFGASDGSIETLFIGGGTPSTIDPELYQPLFELISPYLAENAEMTTEANPNSADESWLQGMRTLGINRISFGVQSFDLAKLRALNRAHSPREAAEAIEHAADLGYEHLSLDLIYNFRGDDEVSLLSDIDRAFSLPIDHLSAYELTIESNTFFTNKPEARQQDDELAHFVARSIQERGFTQYEISNFGRHQSRHNQGYWRLENYIGAGAGAVGFLENRRYYPQNDIDAYIADPLKISEEALSTDELLMEQVFLGLRSTIGIEKRILPVAMQQKADELLDAGKLNFIRGSYQNPDFFLADEIALYLLD